MKLRAACIMTRSAAPLVDFYEKILQQAPEVDGGVDFRFCRGQLTIFQMGEGEGPETRGLALIYEVNDVDAEYARLNALGIVCRSAPTDKPWGVRSFMIEDPTGNLISFVKDLRA
jgi:predicted enzyme related to lactoylglutathione lyase